MKTDSPLFDSIRVKPDKDRRPRVDLPACEWPTCKAAATHRAPKGRQRENEHWRFCLGHVRQYNHSYNFFAGMSDDAILKYQKDAVTGHRPTWKMGMNGGKPTGRSHSARLHPDMTDDPFGVFRDIGVGVGHDADGEHLRRRETRIIRNAERKALEVLGLEADANTHDIKVEVQGAGEAAPSRRQWRRPLHRGSPAGHHRSLQLLEISGFSLIPQMGSKGRPGSARFRVGAVSHQTGDA